MAVVPKILDRMRREPANVRFVDLKKVCIGYFGKPRQSGSSHLIFKTPWLGDPRINIQDAKGKAKDIKFGRCCLLSKNWRPCAMNVDHYTYRVTWSSEDREHLGLCAEFPSLSWLARTPQAALNGGTI